MLLSSLPNKEAWYKVAQLVEILLKKINTK